MLTDESQQKVEHIYCIANLLKNQRVSRLGVDEFDYLYDKPLDELEHLSGYIKSRVLNIEGE